MTVASKELRVASSEQNKWPGWKTWVYTWRVALFRPGIYFGMTGIELYIFALAPLIVGALRATYKHVSYYEVTSHYGHDAFLLEREKMEGIIGTFLASGARSFTAPDG